MKISGIVITKNEEKMLGECLRSLSWVDELLVVDTGSTDKTVNIAHKNGATVINSKGKNFSDWRNFGLKNAKSDWILYIDADERVTPKLKKELETIINIGAADKNFYAVPRKNIILGKEFHFGGQSPDYVKRLFKREELKGWKGELHEEPVIKGQIGHLKNKILHIKHEDFTEMVEKTNLWSDIEAKLMFEAGHPPMNVVRFLSAISREFGKRMIVQTAFLDGPEGIVYALYQVFSRFVSYTKLWELQYKAGKVK